MAGKAVGSASGERRGSRKGAGDEKQSKLFLEVGNSSKKVTFKDEEYISKKELMEMSEKLRKEFNDKLKEEKEKWEEMSAKVKDLEERIEGYEAEIKDLREELRGERDETGSFEARSNYSVATSRRSSWRGGYSRASSGEERDGSCDRLSVREVGRVRRLMNDQEKEKRRNNKVIKGLVIEKEMGKVVTKEMVGRWIKEKIGVEVKVTDCRSSGNCLIATLDREEMKSEVMRNKSKLRGEKFFIENDLTWDERKVQERIYRWAKQEREKGIFIKVGFARVQIRGVWRKWEKIEKELKDREEREGG